MPDNENVVERIQDIRDEILDIAADRLRAHDEPMYSGLSEVAWRLTALIPPDGSVSDKSASGHLTVSTLNTDGSVASESRVMEEDVYFDSDIIPIFASYGRDRQRAKLDPRRISSGGRGRCVLYEGEWMTTSRAAGNITGRATNGWTFWTYERSDGAIRPIQEIRDRELRATADEVPW